MSMLLLLMRPAMGTAVPSFTANVRRVDAGAGSR
jgi:hypothetical protein